MIWLKKEFPQLNFDPKNFFCLAWFWLEKVDFWLDWLESQIPKLLDSTRLDSQWLGWLVTRAISDSTHPYPKPGFGLPGPVPPLLTAFLVFLMCWAAILLFTTTWQLIRHNNFTSFFSFTVVNILYFKNFTHKIFFPWKWRKIFPI